MPENAFNPLSAIDGSGLTKYVDFVTAQNIRDGRRMVLLPNSTRRTNSILFDDDSHVHEVRIEVSEANIDSLVHWIGGGTLGPLDLVALSTPPVGDTMRAGSRLVTERILHDHPGVLVTATLVHRGTKMTMDSRRRVEFKEPWGISIDSCSDSRIETAFDHLISGSQHSLNDLINLTDRNSR